MLMAPADSPNNVTFAGSPPNAAMFSFTQRSSVDLVAQAPVARSAVVIGTEPGVSEEPERAKSIVDGDHDGALGGQVRPAEQSARARTRREPTAVQPHHDRPTTVIDAERPHVEVEAILVGLSGVVGEAEPRDRRCLRRDRAPARRVPGTGPGRHGLGGAPPALGPGHAGVGHAPEYPDPSFLPALEHASGRTGHALQTVPPTPERPLVLFKPLQAR